MPRLIDEYRRLLIAEESLAHLDEALALVQRVASGKSVPRSAKWLDLLDHSSANGSDASPRQELDRQVASVMWGMQSLPAHVERRIDQIPASQYSLLLDALLLVFHQAYFALLPKARRQRKPLLTAFFSFARSLPREADRFQVTGLVKLAQKDFEGAIEAFCAAVHSTPADDHAFLTRVQLAWMELIGHGRDHDAFQFLLDISPRVVRKDLEEFNGLLLQSYEVGHSQPRRTVGTSA